MMPKQRDFKQEWEKAKEQLAKTSHEALELAKKGEKELVKFSRRGKLYIDATALDLKREQIYYLIGKEYVKADAPEKPTATLTKLLDEFRRINVEQKALRSRIKGIK